MGDVVPQRLGEQLVGRGQFLLAVPEQHRGTGRERGAGDLSRQRGLAQTCLAGDQHNLSPTVTRHPLVGVRTERDLGRPADHTHIRSDSQASGQRGGLGGCAIPDRCPNHFDGGDRFGQALQLELAEHSTLDLAPAAGHGGHDLCRQNLPAVAPGAKSGSFDDRVAEVVTLLGADLAAADPDPESDSVRRVPVCQVDTLLHRHSRSQCRRGGGEDDHQAVAEVLHLPPTGLGDCLAQEWRNDRVGPGPPGPGTASGTARSSPRCP